MKLPSKIAAEPVLSGGVLIAIAIAIVAFTSFSTEQDSAILGVATAIGIAFGRQNVTPIS